MRIQFSCYNFILLFKNISMSGVDVVTTNVAILDSLPPKLRSGSIF
jgi:hypothetical protein